MKTTIIFLTMLVLLCQCTQNDATPNESTAVFIGIDKTHSTEYSSPVSAEDILSSIYDESGSLDVFISEINDVSLNRISRHHLGQKKRLESSLVRNDEASEFYASLDEKLKKVFEEPNGKQQSSIYLMLCRMVEELLRTGTTEPKVVLFTDFVENALSTTSFYSLYKQNPDFDESYDSIVASLESAETLPDLSGIEILVVFQPDQSTEGLFLQTRKFWSRHLTSKGAQIRFVANL